MVCVEMIAFCFCPSANRTAGTRYARDLPTPVPASTTRCRSSSSARATATAISCCCGRNSKFFAFESRPPSEKIVRTRSTNSVPRESFNAIILEKHPVVLALGHHNGLFEVPKGMNRSVFEGNAFAQALASRRVAQAGCLCSDLRLPFSKGERPTPSTCKSEAIVAKYVCGNAIVIGKANRKSKFENPDETARSLRRPQFFAGLSLLHCRLYLHLAHF